MNRWLWPLVGVSAIGLVSSSAISFFARQGTLTDIGPWEWVLGLGCFVVAVPGFYMSGLDDKSKGLKEHWNLVVAVLGNCPAWLRYPIIVAWLYGAFSGWTSMDLSFGTSLETDLAPGLVGMSGVLMMVYSMSLAMLYSSADQRFREHQVDSQGKVVAADGTRQEVKTHRSSGG